jgi:hypothetical protein
MKLIIPNNIFSTLFVLSLDDDIRPDIEVKDSSLISNEISANPDSIGIIPSLDLIRNTELFVSSKLGISFDSSLGNSYLYFQGTDEIDEIHLRGDISSNEVILSKIAFLERYNIEPTISLESADLDRNNSFNYHIVGSENWSADLFTKGTSFNDQVVELIDSPYVNFLFASKNEKILKEFENKTSNIFSVIIDKLEDNLNQINLGDAVSKLIKEEISSVFFNITQIEKDGIQQLLELVYYHKIIENLFDVKYV